ncbi:hypothetical protein [Actinocrinis sp.]|uniref:hypothetical protein n=1 Tax=Actinocrinis sp. TaxID=1920516 RepID=UPI002D298A2B|nr:hypothetical protein [Actinocrinis sp.]HZP54863.1 hypothetical protein [Actinocrinis sp.]
MIEHLLARVIRAAALAAVCVLLAAVGHVLASQKVLPQSTVLQAWGAALCIGWCFARRERTLPSIAAFVLGAQAVLYLWFQAAQIHEPVVRCAAVTTLPPGLTVPGMCGTAVPGWAQTALMVGSHVIAALICAWWLRRGEAALFLLGRVVLGFGRTLLCGLAALLRACDFVPFAGPRRERFARDRRRPRRLPSGALQPVVRRGPPVGLRTA